MVGQNVSTQVDKESAASAHGLSLGIQDPNRNHGRANQIGHMLQGSIPHFNDVSKMGFVESKEPYPNQQCEKAS